MPAPTISPLGSQAILVEIAFDDESQNYAFRVPALHIVGGGAATFAEAVDKAVAAIEFARESSSDDGAHDGATVYRRAQLSLSVA